MVISPTQLMIIVHNLNVQALKFLLGSELDKIMGSSINSANVLLTIEPKTTMQVMILATGGGSRTAGMGSPRSSVKDKDIWY